MAKTNKKTKTKHGTKWLFSAFPKKGKGVIVTTYPHKSDELVIDSPLGDMSTLGHTYITDKKYISALAWRTTKEYWDFKPILKEFINEYLPGVTYV